MSQTVERLGYGQFYPGNGTSFLLYDGPDEWGIRVDAEGVSVGDAAEVSGEYPCYEIRLPSGMKGFITDSSTATVVGANFTAQVGAGEHLRLADAVRSALAAARPAPAT